MEPMTRIERDYEFPAAGRVWVVPAFRLTRARDGTWGATMTEFHRIHRAIALAVCGRPGPLTVEEFVFLHDIADVPYAQIARLLGLDRSALTKWMDSGNTMRSGRSNLLKRWFLVTLFADQIGPHMGTEGLEEDARLLPRLYRRIRRRSGNTLETREHGSRPTSYAPRLEVSFADPPTLGSTQLHRKSQFERRRLERRRLKERHDAA